MKNLFDQMEPEIVVDKPNEEDLFYFGDGPEGSVENDEPDDALKEVSLDSRQTQPKSQEDQSVVIFDFGDHNETQSIKSDNMKDQPSKVFLFEDQPEEEDTFYFGDNREDDLNKTIGSNNTTNNPPRKFSFEDEPGDNADNKGDKDVNLGTRFGPDKPLNTPENKEDTDRKEIIKKSVDEQIEKTGSTQTYIAKGEELRKKNEFEDYYGMSQQRYSDLMLGKVVAQDEIEIELAIEAMRKMSGSMNESYFERPRNVLTNNLNLARQLKSSKPESDKKVGKDETLNQARDNSLLAPRNKQLVAQALTESDKEYQDFQKLKSVQQIADFTGTVQRFKNSKGETMVVNPNKKE